MKQSHSFPKINILQNKLLNLNLIKQQTMSSSSSSSNKMMVYIARVETNMTEQDIRCIIEDNKIGRVSYVDFTAVKDNSPDAGPNPAFKFYSAFVMMSDWNPKAYHDLLQNGQIKVYTSSRRDATYLILREGKEGSEIPRSKVNIHQLAAYTAELYNRADIADKQIARQAETISIQDKKLAIQGEQIMEHTKLMNAMVDTAMTHHKEMAEMKSVMERMNSFMCAIQQQQYDMHQAAMCAMQQQQHEMQPAMYTMQQQQYDDSMYYQDSAQEQEEQECECSENVLCDMCIEYQAELQHDDEQMVQQDEDEECECGIVNTMCTKCMDDEFDVIFDRKQ